RQRDMALVDEVDLRDVTDVRHSVAIGGRDHTRDDPVKATIERVEPDRGHGTFSPVGSGILTPATGPGVCAKTCAISRSIAHAGHRFRPWVTTSGMPTHASDARNTAPYRIASSRSASSPSRIA